MGIGDWGLSHREAAARSLSASEIAEKVRVKISS